MGLPHITLDTWETTWLNPSLTMVRSWWACCMATEVARSYASWLLPLGHMKTSVYETKVDSRAALRDRIYSGRTYTQPSKQHWFRYSIPLDACRKLHCSWRKLHCSWWTLWTINVTQVLILVQLCKLILECAVSHITSPLGMHMSCIMLGSPRTTITLVQVFL